MILLIDNFDSFSHILADYFLRTGVELRIVRNDVSVEELKGGNYQALVISPGPETPAKAGNLMEILAYYADKLPILGVCLGHQAIGQYFGADLVKSRRPMHGKVSMVTQIGEHPLFANLPKTFQVTRYHSLELTNLPETLETILVGEKGEIMGVSHRSLPIIGVQFHPEAHLTAYGLDLIADWVLSVRSL
ncbi:MAG TPA: aminodeoxychorismate/anthranilate synthase component II [Lunatimonas sp.]|nr:aminodeoxychorismate/anthranilate synthase component II [Lunatimonas sp.]